MRRVGWPLLAAILCVGFLAGLASPVGALPGQAYVTSQRFEHGQMIWRSDTSEIWVLFDGGRAQVFAPSSYQRLPENPYMYPPSGLVRPILGFGKVWGRYADIRTGLGWATQPEIGYTAQVQVEPDALYLRQLDGLWIAITGGSTWIYMPGPPPQGASVIWFTASPNPARPGQTVTLSWQAVGAELVQIGLFDAASGDQEPFSLIDGLALTDSLTLPMPTDKPGGVLAIAWAADRIPGAPPPAATRRAQMALLIDVATGQAGALTPRATYQPFERGFMIWREDTSAVLIFWGDANGGQWTSVPATQYSGFRDNPIDSPAPFVRPIMGFGRVWGSLQYVRDVLGYATGHEEGYVTRIEPQTGPTSLLLPDGRVVHLSGNTWTF